LIEAMAAGVPVVTTDSPGCRDVVSHEYNGLLATPGDPMSLADNIEKLAKNCNLRKELCTNALMDVGKYDYSLIANQYSDLYSQLIREF
jgi:glycosyltransferase involved in cell wall biosynthesis